MSINPTSHESKRQRLTEDSFVPTRVERHPDSEARYLRDVPRRISAAATAKRIDEWAHLCREHIHQLSYSDVVAAMRSLAVTVRRNKLDAQIPHDCILNHVLPIAAERFGEATADHLSSLARAVATLHIRDERFCAALSAAVIKKVDGFNAMDIACVAWAFALWEYRDEPLFGALRAAALQLDQFSSIVLTDITWAFARMGCLDSLLCEKLSGAIGRTICSMQPAQLADCIWAFRSVQFPAPWLAEAERRVTHNHPRHERERNFEAQHIREAGLARRTDEWQRLCSESLWHLDPYILANALNGLARGTLDHNPISDATRQFITTRLLPTGIALLPSCNACDLSMISWSLAMLGIYDTAFCKALRNAALEKAGSFIPIELANTAYAFATWEQKDEPLFDAIRAAVLKQNNLAPEHLNHLAWAFARVGRLDRELCKMLGNAIEPLFDRMNSRQQADCVWAFQSVRFQAPWLARAGTEDVLPQHLRQLLASIQQAGTEGDVSRWMGLCTTHLDSLSGSMIGGALSALIHGHKRRGARLPLPWISQKLLPVIIRDLHSYSTTSIAIIARMIDWSGIREPIIWAVVQDTLNRRLVEGKLNAQELTYSIPPLFRHANVDASLFSRLVRAVEQERDGFSQDDLLMVAQATSEMPFRDPQHTEFLRKELQQYFGVYTGSVSKVGERSLATGQMQDTEPQHVLETHAIPSAKGPKGKLQRGSPQALAGTTSGKGPDVVSPTGLRGMRNAADAPSRVDGSPIFETRAVYTADDLVKCGQIAYQLNIHDQQFLEELGEALYCCCGNISPEQLSHAAFYFNELMPENGLLMGSIAESARQNGRHIPMQSLATIVNVFGKRNNTPLLDALALPIQSRMEHGTVEDLIKCFLGYAELDSTDGHPIEAALHKQIFARLEECTPFGLANLLKALSYSSCVDLDSIERVAQEIQEHASELSDGAIVTSLSSLASLGIVHKGAIAALRTICVERMTNFSALSVGNVLWAFSKLSDKVVDTELFTAASRAMQQHLRNHETVDPKAISRCVSAFSQVRFADADLLQAMRSAVLRQVTHTGSSSRVGERPFASGQLQGGRSPVLLETNWRPPNNADAPSRADGLPTRELRAVSIPCQQLATIAMSFALLGIRDRELFDAIASAAQADVKNALPRTLGELGWAFGSVNAPYPALFDALAKRTLHILPEMTTNALCDVIYGCASSGYTANNALYRKVGAELLKQIDDLSHLQLVQIARSFSCQTHIDRDFFHVLLPAFRASIDRFDPTQLARIAHIYAEIAMVDESLFTALSRAMRGYLSQPDEIQPHQLVMMAKAYGALDVPDMALLNAMIPRLEKQLDDVAPEDLVTLMSVYAGAHHTNSGFFQALATAITPHLDRLQAFKLQQLKNALTAMRAHVPVAHPIWKALQRATAV